MTMNRWGARSIVGLLVVVLLGVAAGASAFAPFDDAGVDCGAPIAVAAHGKVAMLLQEGTATKLVVLPSAERERFQSGLFGISGNRLPGPPNVVVCRTPARDRTLVAGVLLGAAVLGVLFVTRRRSGERSDELVVSPS